MSGRTRNIWFISDTHFFHENILTFKDNEGKLIRGRDFSDVTQMNETIIQNWNSVVRPQDKVYHLGDVAVGVRNQQAFTDLMKALNGHKRLLLGNHDHLEQPAYRQFERIELWTGGKFKEHNFVASHIPLRPDQMRDGEFNVHGHTHQNRVKWLIDEGSTHELWGYDERYINVCVEQTGYKLVHLDEIRAKTRSS